MTEIFSAERLTERYNADLANGLGNLVSRTLNMIEKFTPALDRGVSLPLEMVDDISQIDTQIESLAFDKALTNTWKLIAWADQLIEENKPWEMAKAGQQEEIEQILAQLLTALEVINEKIAPFLPQASEKLSELLQARPLKKPQEPLFARR